jgi:hypothetical protein
MLRNESIKVTLGFWYGRQTNLFFQDLSVASLYASPCYYEVVFA